jgi:hypothetical protein
MACILKEERPRWRELFYGPDHPSWLEWTSRGLDAPPDTPPDVADEEQQSVDEASSRPDIFDEIIASRRE